MDDTVRSILGGTAFSITAELEHDFPEIVSLSVWHKVRDLVRSDLHMLLSGCYSTTWTALGADSSNSRPTARQHVHRESDPRTSATLAYFAEARDLLEIRTEYLLRHWRDFFHRLDADSDRIAESSTPALLADLRGGLSDPHHRGSQVLVCDFFESSVVYKPRDIGAEAAWTRLCEVLNDSGRADESGITRFATARALPATGYGWVEYIQEAPKRSPVMLRKLCAMAMVLHRLGATDIHAENVVLSPQGPVLVDAETVLSPDPGQILRVDAPSSAEMSLETVLQTSTVAGWINRQRNGWAAIGPIQNLVDELHCAGYSEADLSSAMYRGYEDGTVALDRTIAQFGGGRRLLERLGFTGFPVRLLVRPTAHYSRLLSESVRAEHMVSAETRKQCLEKLRHLAENQPSNLSHRIVNAEIEALREGDIPHFCVDPVSNAVMAGDEPLGSLDGSSPLERAVRRLDAPSRYTVGSALDVTRAALRNAPNGFALPQASTATSDVILASEADSRARACMRHHTRSASGVPIVVGAAYCPLTARTIIAPLETGLYSGLSGPLLMYAACHRVLRDPDFAAAASDILEAVSALSRAPSPQAWLGFTGPTSDLYALTTAAWLIPGLDISEQRSACLRQLHSSRRFLADVRRRDVVGGLSGCLLALVAAAENGVAGLDSCIEELSASVTAAWAPPEASARLESLGMAHGLLGASYAALRTAHYANNARDTAMWAERVADVCTAIGQAAQRDPGHGSVSWCRGMAGAAAALLGVEQMTGSANPQTSALLDRLLTRSPLAQGRCLCCGGGSLR